MQCPQGHHQVPDEEGSLLERRRGQHRDDRGPADGEHPPGHELPGVAAQEALAEREEPPHQVHHGTGPEAVLE